MLAEGTLVSIKPSALKEPTIAYDVNVTHVEQHGWLWIVGDTRGTNIYYCRSLATGATAVWYEDEVEAAAQEQAKQTQGTVTEQAEQDTPE